MKYTVDFGDKWSSPMSKAKLYRIFCIAYKAGYGTESTFESWLKDVKKLDLVREV